MRVLLVHPRLSIRGGAEQVAIHSIRTALNQGHEVYLLTEKFDVEAFEDFFGCQGLFRDVETLAYPTFHPIIPKRFLMYQRMIYYQAQHRRILSANQELDLGLVLSTQDVGYVPSTKAPIVHYCYFPEFFHLQFDPSFKPWRLYYWPASLFYRQKVGQIGKLLSVSEYTKRYVRQLWSRDSTILYPPCPVDEYSLSNSFKENVVITIGRLVPEKRHHIFLEIARRLPGLNFTIIGSVAEGKESYYERLVGNAPKNARILLSPLMGLKSILERAKVYVHCAENEHFGIAIVEAMASGCVPVVHDSGGPREIVTDQVGYRWKNLSEAVDKIARLVSDEMLRREMSAAASARAQLYSSAAFESGLAKILVDYER